MFNHLMESSTVGDRPMRFRMTALICFCSGGRCLLLVVGVCVMHDALMCLVSFRGHQTLSHQPRVSMKTQQSAILQIVP